MLLESSYETNNILEQFRIEQASVESELFSRIATSKASSSKAASNCSEILNYMGEIDDTDPISNWSNCHDLSWLTETGRDR